MSDNKKIRLTSLASCAGWASKVGPEALAQVLRPLVHMFDPVRYPDLLRGRDPPDDALVWKIDAQRALVHTADFFPPVVDDPYAFGAVAACNALSDIYAMGGEPLFALNLVGFPEGLDPAILSEILRGGGEKVREAGAVVAGGHTTTDKEPKRRSAIIRSDVFAPFGEGVVQLRANHLLKRGASEVPERSRAERDGPSQVTEPPAIGFALNGETVNTRHCSRSRRVKRMADEKKLSVSEVRRTIAVSLAAAFGFVIALLWNEVVKSGLILAGVDTSLEN